MTKINLAAILIAFFTSFIITGCTSTGFLMASPEVIMIGKAGTPKPPTAKIDIYYTNKPKKKYDEIAIIKVADTDDEWSLNQIKIKARELGADGVVIIGRSSSYGYVTGGGTSTNSLSTSIGIGATKGYGLEAIAIMYK